MTEDMYPKLTARTAKRRRSLAPELESAFAEFSGRVFVEGALPVKVKELIAVAVAHVTQCPYRIRSHTHRAQRRGATAEEIMEAIWVAAEMRAGAAAAQAAIAIDAMERAARAEPSVSTAASSRAARSGASEVRADAHL